MRARAALSASCVRAPPFCFVRSGAAKGPLMALFRRYADEMGASILVADAVMMVATVLVAHGLARLRADDAAAAGAIAAYVGMLVVYSF